MSEKLELISFKLCPFVQRTIIVLNYKQIEFDITYIDINDPPEWFKSISPLGKVPVLKIVDDILFESAVIQEYVDEITLPSLQPVDPLVKAKNRAWIQFGSGVLMAMHSMVMAKEPEEVDELRQSIQAKLYQLEMQHSGASFFNGNTFNLIDAAYAPMLMRLDFINKLTQQNLLESCPKLSAWQIQLLAMPAVENSVVEGFDVMYKSMIKNMDGFLATQLTD